ncbi:MAG: response regulator [Phycisphaera sp.]|nr:response regulator [Phycisphaera sp.]
MVSQTGEIPKPPLDADAQTPGQDKPLRVLVVEDDDATRIAMSYILNQSGIETTQARNGVEAVSAFKSQPFEAVLMDIEMPVMDGFRAMSIIRREPRAGCTPILMLSQLSSNNHVRQAVSLGAVDFVVKQNLKPEVLVNKLRKHAAAAKSKSQDSVKASNTERSIGSTPNPEAEQTVDQTQWRKLAQELGRTDREAMRTTMAEVLPPLVIPDAIKQIKDLATDSRKSDQLGAMIEQVPVALAKIIGHANHSQETSNSKALDIPTAMNWIGKAGLDVALSEIKHFPTQLLKPLDDWVLHWWRHSIAVSRVAGELAVALEEDPNLARVAGALHDIGRLLMLASPMPNKVLKCYDSARNMIFPTSLAEQVLFGINHRTIGVEFCERMGLPAILSSVCDVHELDDAQRARLRPEEARLSAVICAADQAAKSSGFGSLPNDDLLPLPADLATAMTELELQINQALEEADALTQFQMGKKSPAPTAEAAQLAGIVVGFLSPVAGPYNPYQRTLKLGGASLTAFTDAKALMDNPPLVDVLVIDQMSATLTTFLPMLRRMAQIDTLRNTPTLLLARRSDEPETIINQSGLSAHVYASPIRRMTLLQTVRRLAGT